jgi:hypothetical protein
VGDSSEPDPDIDIDDDLPSIRETTEDRFVPIIMGLSVSLAFCMSDI